MTLPASVAPSGGCPDFFRGILGLTPQANHMSPLRGSERASEGSQSESGIVCSGAPEARQMHSLGREPPGRRVQSTYQPPEGAADSEPVTAPVPDVTAHGGI